MGRLTRLFFHFYFFPFLPFLPKQTKRNKTAFTKKSSSHATFREMKKKKVLALWRKLFTSTSLKGKQNQYGVNKPDSTSSHKTCLTTHFEGIVASDDEWEESSHKICWNPPFHTMRQTNECLKTHLEKKHLAGSVLQTKTLQFKRKLSFAGKNRCTNTTEKERRKVPTLQRGFISLTTTTCSRHKRAGQRP